MTEPRFIASNADDIVEIDGRVLRRTWEMAEGEDDGQPLDWYTVDRVTGQRVFMHKSEEDALQSAAELSVKFPDGLPVPD